jgi:hypothetical protein
MELSARVVGCVGKFSGRVAETSSLRPRDAFDFGGSASTPCRAVGERPLFACAVRRPRFPVGARPTRRTLQPEATGAVMEVTKWLKPSVWLVTYRALSGLASNCRFHGSPDAS